MYSGIPHTPIQGHELLHPTSMVDESDLSGAFAGIRSQRLGKRLFQDVHSISTHLTTAPIMDVDDIVMENTSHPSNIGRSQSSRDGSDLLADEAPRSPLISVFEGVERLHGTQVAVPDIGHSVYHAFFASTTNDCAGTFKPTETQIQGINDVKRQVTDFGKLTVRCTLKAGRPNSGATTHVPACHDPDVSRGGNSSAVCSLCIDQRQVCQHADTQRFLGQEHHFMGPCYVSPGANLRVGCRSCRDCACSAVFLCRTVTRMKPE